MLLIMGSLVAGVVIGISGMVAEGFVPYLNKITTVTLFVMLAILGAQIGCNSELLNNLTLLGWRAVIISFLSILGSVAAVWLAVRWFKLSQGEGEKT